MKKVLSLLGLALASGALVVAGVSKHESKEVKAEYESKITVDAGFFTNWTDAAGGFGDQNSTFWDQHYSFEAVDTFYRGELAQGWTGTLTSRTWKQHEQYIYFQLGGAKNTDVYGDPVHLNIYYGGHQSSFYNDTFRENRMLMRYFKIPDAIYADLMSKGDDFDMHIEIVDYQIEGYGFANFGYLNVNQTAEQVSNALRWYVNHLNRDDRDVEERQRILDNYFMNAGLRELFLKPVDDISDTFDNNGEFVDHWYFDYYYAHNMNWDYHVDRAIGHDSFRPGSDTQMPFNNTNGFFRGWFENDELGGFVGGDGSRYRFVSRPFVLSGTGLVSIKMAGTASLHVIDSDTQSDLVWADLLTYSKEGDQVNLATSNFNTVTMVRHVINLEAYVGRKIQLAIADVETGDWSALYVDELITNFESYPGLRVDKFSQSNDSGTFNGYKIDKYINSKLFDEENNPTGMKYVLENPINQADDGKILNHLDNSPIKEAYDFLNEYYSLMRSPSNEFDYEHVASEVKESLVNHYASLSYKAREIIKSSTDIEYSEEFSDEWWSHPVDTSKMLSNSFATLAHSQVKNIISFESGIGVGSMPNVINVEGKYQLPNSEFTPIAGYQFVGWKVNGVGVTLSVGEEITVTSDVNLVAQWEEIPVTKYTISFDGGIAQGNMDSVVLDEGSTYKLPSNGFIVPEGYAFKCWHVGDEEVAKNPGDEIIVTSDIVIHAVFEAIPQYVVSFDANGGRGSIASVTVYSGSLVTLPECTFEAPQGKRFIKWKFGDELKNPGDQILVEKDEVIKAVWEDIPVTYYTVSFVSNGGSGSMESINVIEGSTCALPESTFIAPLGKKFSGWKVGEDSTLRAPGYEFVVTSNTVVSAVWEADPTFTFTVRFDGNGGTGTMAEMHVHEGEQFTFPSCSFTAPEGKEFGSWLIGSVKYQPGDVITISGDVTIKAGWVNSSEDTPAGDNGTDEPTNQSKGFFDKLLESFKKFFEQIAEFFKNLFKN